MEKVWNDADNVDGKRPESIMVQLYKNDGSTYGKQEPLNKDNNWRHTWKNLPTGDDYYAVELDSDSKTLENNAISIKDEHGKALYTVNYTNVKNIDVYAPNHPAKGVTVKLTKDGQDVTNADGTLVTQVLNEENQWTATFANLDRNGNYDVVRTTPVPNENDPQDYLYQFTKYEYNGTVATNTHDQDKIPVSVTKKWLTTESLDDKPVTLNLYADNSDTPLKSITLNGQSQETPDYKVNADNDKKTWTVEWLKLPKNELKDGKSKEIKYTVKEAETPKGYETSYADAGQHLTNNGKSDGEKYTAATNGGFIYNIHLIDFTVTKFWSDTGHEEEKPEEINVEITLLKGDKGSIVKNKFTLKADNNWTAIWENLPEYDDAGNPITYKLEKVVEEKPDKRYELTYDKDKPVITNKISFTNTYQTTSVKVTKNWDDKGHEADRPESVTFDLYSGKNKIGAITLDGEPDNTGNTGETDSWTAEWNNLAKFDKDGKEIKYTVKEETAENNNYKVSYPEKRDYALNGELITNTYKPKETPTPTTTPEVTPTPTPTASTPVETPETSPTPTPTVTPPVPTPTATPETKNVSVTKRWLTTESLDGKQITLDLYADGKKQEGKSVTLDGKADDTVNNPAYYEDSAWHAVWKNLPKYRVDEKTKESKKIRYTVKESTTPDGYQTTYTDSNGNKTRDGKKYKAAGNGGYIYNVHLTEFTVTKKWEDNNNSEGKRPDKIKVRLYKGEKGNYSEKELNDKNHWTYTWKNLPEVDENGKTIKYTVEETDLDKNYISSVESNGNSVVITNTYKEEPTPTPTPTATPDVPSTPTPTPTVTPVPDVTSNEVKLTIHKTFKGDQIPDENKKNLKFRVTGTGKKTDENGNVTDVKVDETVSYASFINGSYTFYHLYPGEYTVAETNSGINGYKVSVKYVVDGKTSQKVNAVEANQEYRIDITDEYHKDAEKKNTVDTSDHTNLPWSAGILGISMLIGITALVFRKRYN